MHFFFVVPINITHAHGTNGDERNILMGVSIAPGAYVFTVIL